MFIDAHTHLDFFESNIDKAIKEINDLEILTVANSMNVESYLKNKEYAKKSEYIISTFGLHPWEAKNFDGDLEDLLPFIEESELIGEIGLDFFWEENKTTYEKQREVYYFMLKEATKRNKVVSIHTKGAEEEIYLSLKNLNYHKAIIHWYSGSLDTLKRFIDLGCYFTISVDLGYADKALEVLNEIPLDKLLIETDGPTAKEWVNGEYAYPSAIIDVYKKVSEIKNIELNKLKKIVEENLKRIINNN